MKKPRIIGNGWVMTLGYVSPDAEEMWNLSPNEGDWSAVIHLQKSGKMYVTILRNRKGLCIDPNILAESIRRISEMVYEKEGIRSLIMIRRDVSSILFSVVPKAGFRRQKKYVQNKFIVYEFNPGSKK